jgi:hypothetical protein
MSERERWVVYPLLFLALGAALRDKLIDRTMTKSIVCQELTILDDDSTTHAPRVLARIGRTEPTDATPSLGYLFVNGEVDVQGVVKINGLINARHYAMQGVAFIPALPGLGVPDLRALQQLQEKQKQSPRQPKQPDTNNSRGARSR